MNILRTSLLAGLLVLAFACLPSRARAQELADTVVSHDTLPDNTIRQLDKVVVTATRTERELSDLPISTTVIDRQHIEISPAANVIDLLADEPGVTVRRVVGMAEGIPADIIIRGVPGSFAAARTLILVDGIPTNVAGTPLLLANVVPLDAVERVEVVRGPSSSLYGANAFNGVVNTVLRQPVRRHELRLSHEFWPTLYTDLEGWYGGNHQRVAYWIAGSTRRISNYLVRDSAMILEEDGSTTYDAAENYDFRDNKLLGRFTWWLDENAEVSLNARYFDSDLGFGVTQDSLRVPMRITGQTFLVGPSASFSLGNDLDLTCNGFYRRLLAEHYSDARVDSVGLVSSYWAPVSDEGQAGVQATVSIGTHNLLTSGVDYVVNSIDFPAIQSREQRQPLPGYRGTAAADHNIGVYLQDEFTWRQLTMVPTMRLDYNTQAGFVPSPRFACAYRFGETATTRLSHGMAFRAPTHVELHTPDMPLLDGVRMVGNDTLHPEYIRTIDGGIGLRLGDIFRPNLDVFYNRMYNLISPAITYVVPSGDLDSVQVLVAHRNVSDAWSAGFVVSGSLRLPDWIEWSADYTFTESRDMQFEAELDYVPQHALGLGTQVNRAVGPLNVAAQLSESYVGSRSYLVWQGSDATEWVFSADSSTLVPPRRELPGHWRTDLSLRIGFRTHAYVAFELRNAFDATYEESGGVLAPGRMAALRIGGGF